MSRKEFSTEVLASISDLLSQNAQERTALNRNRIKGDDDCGICEEIMILRGRAEGILLVEARLRERGLL